MKFIFIFRYLRELPAQIGKWLFENVGLSNICYTDCKYS